MKIGFLFLFFISINSFGEEFRYVDSNWTKFTIDLDKSINTYSDAYSDIKKCSHPLLSECFSIDGIYFALPQTAMDGNYQYARVKLSEDLLLIFWDVKMETSFFGEEYKGYSIQIIETKSNNNNNVLIYDPQKGILMFHNKNGTFLSSAQQGLFNRSDVTSP